LGDKAIGLTEAICLHQRPHLKLIQLNPQHLVSRLFNHCWY